MVVFLQAIIRCKYNGFLGGLLLIFGPGFMMKFSVPVTLQMEKIMLVAKIIVF